VRSRNAPFFAVNFLALASARNPPSGAVHHAHQTNSTTDRTIRHLVQA